MMCSPRALRVVAKAKALSIEFGSQMTDHFAYHIRGFLPPADYQKLQKVLTEMEEKEIIRESISEYASTLVMVLKKDDGLRLCKDFRWLNARHSKMHTHFHTNLIVLQP